jgi:DNA-binding NarL/FixJ family response regulator
VRVVLAEDLYLLRNGIERMLHAYGMQVVAAVDNGPDLLDALLSHRPDVAVVDVRLPPTHTDEGLRAAIAIRRDHPATGVLLFSQYIETRHAANLFGAGAAGVGYLLKDGSPTSASSSRRSAGWQAGGPPSIRRSSRSCWAPVAAPTGSACSPRGSATCSA